MKGKELIKITGHDFPENISTIYIGSVNVDVIFSNSNEIAILSPAMKPGFYFIKIKAGALGNVK